MFALLNAEAPVVQTLVAPADRSGVIVNFGVTADVASAVLILTARDGRVVPLLEPDHLGHPGRHPEADHVPVLLRGDVALVEQLVEAEDAAAGIAADPRRHFLQ